MRDPPFLADAKKTVLDVSPVSGAELDAMIALKTVHTMLFGKGR